MSVVDATQTVVDATQTTGEADPTGGTAVRADRTESRRRAAARSGGTCAEPSITGDARACTGRREHRAPVDTMRW